MTVFDYTALLSSRYWYPGAPSGSPVFLTFSFPEHPSAWLVQEDPERAAAFIPFSESQKEIARAAVSQFTSVSGIKLVEVTQSDGDLVFGMYDFAALGLTSAGFATYPNSRSFFASDGSLDVFSNEAPAAGDIYIDSNLAPTQLAHVLVHEIGHAVGLKHPFDGTPVLDPTIDNGSNTVMSYNGPFLPSLGALDVSALQHIYGLVDEPFDDIYSWDATTETLTVQSVLDNHYVRGSSARDIVYVTGKGDAVVTEQGDDAIHLSGQAVAVNGGTGVDTVYSGIAYTGAGMVGGNSNFGYVFLFGGQFQKLSKVEYIEFTNGLFDLRASTFEPFSISVASLSTLDAVRPEGTVASTVFSFRLELDQAAFTAVSVDWGVAGSGADPATASDFVGGVLPGGRVTFAAGEASKTITIEVAADAALEADESFTLTLSNPSVGLSIGMGSADGKIVNDDASGVSIAAVSAAKAEEDSGTIPFTFEVTLSQAVLATQTIDWAVTGSGDHAADGADFLGGTLPHGTVTFSAGEASKMITLPVSGDTTVEFDDFFTVTLSNPSGGLSLGAASALGIIQNDDRARISIAPFAASKAEGDSGTTAFTFAVSFDQASFAEQVADWMVTGSGGNPAAAADFGGVLPSGKVTFAAGETSKVVTILVSGDTAAEFNEDFAVTLSNLTFGLLMGTASATGTILNDDRSVVSVSAGPGSKAEGTSGASAFAWTVSLDRAGVTSQTVAWAITGSGAHAADGTDLAGGVLPSGTLTFAPGETTKTVTVDVGGDSVVEFDEGLVLTLSAPSSGLDLGTATMAGTVVNDDLSVVSIVAQSASKVEGNSGTTAFTFTVGLSQVDVTSQTVGWSVVGSGANAADAADFGGAFPSGKVTFAAGETSQVVTILVSGDTAAEFNEDFAVTLSNLTFGLLLGTASATGTILNDDRSVVSVAAGPGSKAEGNGGTSAFAWTVSLDRAGVTSQAVAWAIAGSGAHAADGTDLAGGVLPSGTLTFAPGETTKSVTVDVVGDAAVEFDEGLVLTLSAPSSGLDLGTTTMAGTVVNDDLSAVSIAAQSASKAEGNSGTTAFTFTVTLSQAGVTSQTVDWKVTGTGANAADAADFGGALPAGTVTFAAGETSKVVTIQVAGDSAAESNESFLVSLSNLSSGLELGTATAGSTILDDDGSVSIAALLAAKAEGNSGPTAFTFTVTTTGDSSATRSVAWAVSGSGASKADAADFAGGALPAGTLTFNPSETSKVLTITVNGDTTVEPDEGFQVSLSNPSSSLKIGTGSASGTIQNDDSLPVTVAAHDDAYIVLEGQSLTIAAASGVLFNDQSASSASLLANAGHGAVQLAGTGGFGYTPAAGFTGIDSFTYHAVPGGNGVDGKAVLYVVPVNTGASTTLDLLGLTAAEQIAATYAAFFGRAADAGGHGFWVGQFVQNLPTQGAAALFANIASSFGISDEAKALYPFLVSPFTATDAQISDFLDSVYNNLFNRSSDAGGLAYWTGAIKATLQAGQFVGSVLVNIMSGAQDSTAGKDITTLMGKVAVSLEYVHEQQEHGTVWSGAGDTAAATNLLRTVTSDAASVLVGVRNAEVLIANHA